MKSQGVPARSLARLALMTAAALALGYLESLLPVTGIPGVKLGLANTVLLYALYLENVKSAWLLMALKVLLSGFLFGGVQAMAYSFAGGILSLAAMALLYRVRGVSVVGVSMAGAVCHNLGQVLLACLMVKSRAVLGYLPVLLISGVVTGLATGVAAKHVLPRLVAGKPAQPNAPAGNEAASPQEEKL